MTDFPYTIEPTPRIWIELCSDDLFVFYHHIPTGSTPVWRKTGKGKAELEWTDGDIGPLGCETSISSSHVKIYLAFPKMTLESLLS